MKSFRKRTLSFILFAAILVQQVFSCVAPVSAMGVGAAAVSLTQAVQGILLSYGISYIPSDVVADAGIVDFNIDDYSSMQVVNQQFEAMYNQSRQNIIEGRKKADEAKGSTLTEEQY